MVRSETGRARPLLRATVAAAALTALVSAAHATLCEPYRPVFRRYRIPVPNFWPSVSILHISDLHVRRANPRLYRAQRAALAGLTPDLLCVTGDLCETAADVELAIDVLGVVKPRAGTFVILGNHEHAAHAPASLREREAHGWRRMVGRVLATLAPRTDDGHRDEAHAIADALSAAGAHVLVNAGKRLVLNGRQLWVSGSDSAWAGLADIAATVRGRTTAAASLALIHEPELAFGAAEAGADLILAGHTHGGQVRFPFIGAPYAHQIDERVRIASGFQRLGDALLHISAGFGQTIPLRWRCPPELVWLDCVPARVSRHALEAAERLAA
jgi:uncharacterized protein